MRSYKKIYDFIKLYNPSLIELYNDIENRPDPQKGFRYKYIKNGKTYIYDHLKLDPAFNDGVAFIYTFKEEGTNNLFELYSINNIYDTCNRHIINNELLYSFWTLFKPI